VGDDSNSPTTPIFPSRPSGPESDWEMPPPAPRVPHSAPTSPLEDEKQELKWKGGSSFPPPLPSLTRKRSESLDEPSSSSGGRTTREVRFASRTEFDSRTSESLVSVELEGPCSEDGEFSMLSPRGGRARSASCHVLSASRPSDSCGTIYEEVGPSATSDVYERGYPHDDK
jgi:hypothetical protein